MKPNCTIALLGNPNCGKTTLFNALTGARQKVGNWPGVTVERKEGHYQYNEQKIHVIDLPGIYSLSSCAEVIATDETITLKFLQNHSYDRVINVVDVTQLERGFYLTLQLLEMGIPVIVVLNRMDVCQTDISQIDLTTLKQNLACEIVPISALKRQGIEELKKMIYSSKAQLPLPLSLAYPLPICDAVTRLNPLCTAVAEKMQIAPQWFSLCLLEGDPHLLAQLTAEQCERVSVEKQNIQQQCQEDADIILADVRYSLSYQLAQSIHHPTLSKQTSVSRLDNLLLNRILGFPCFLALMYFMFLCAMQLGGAFQDFFDLSSQAIFVQGSAYVLSAIHAPAWLIALVAGGVGKGINTVLTFVPVIAFMFLFLGILETSGYMARAAFVMDRFMRYLGLPGKSFVPLIIGFGCNVPAVMAARTLEDPKDRVLTILMTPFMSCSARFAIYAVFSAAFFKTNGQNIVFILYLIGIVMAILSGLMLRKTWLKGETAPLVMELPQYQWPQWRDLLWQTWHKLYGFVTRAGKVIIPLCMVLGCLNALKIDGTFSLVDADAQSVLAYLGRWLTPIFAPMGIQTDNWPATVGLLTGTLAKEVVIATLNALYTTNNWAAVTPNHLSEQLLAAVQTIPQNLALIAQSIIPIQMSAAPVATTNEVLGVMFQRFDGAVGAFAYLLFILLYYPCVSTIAVIARELNRSLALFAVIWSTVLAYTSAVIFYQVATIVDHPWSAIGWISGCVGILIIMILLPRWFGVSKELVGAGSS